MNSAKKDVLLRVLLVFIASATLTAIGYIIWYWNQQDCSVSFKIHAVCLQTIAILLMMFASLTIIDTYRQ